VQPTSLFQPVITRRRLLALGALPTRRPVRLQPNVDRLRFPLFSQQFDFLIDKPSKVLNCVQNRLKLDLNSWSPFVGWFVSANSDYIARSEISYSVILIAPSWLIVIAHAYDCDRVSLSFGVVPRG
jgi:hypothetical protein